VIDGNWGFGYHVTERAMQMTIAKARAANIAATTILRQSHIGRAGAYPVMAAREGFIAMMTADSGRSPKHVAPFGGAKARLGTNPIAIAAPSGGPDPFVLDMATTVAAMGKIKTLAQRGEMMPEGWMVGRDGKPLTDPAKRDDGFLLPIGGAKGYGLSVAIGLLAGVLNGAAFGADVVDFTSDTKSPTNTGQFVAAIDIAAFVGPAEFEAACRQAFGELKASTPLPGHESVRIPGEGRGARLAAANAEGISLAPALRAELAKIAAEFGVPPP